MNYFGTVRQNRKGMPAGFDNNTVKVKQGDVHARVRGNLTAVTWKKQMRRAHIDERTQTTNRGQLL
jgi:hypothetical protein